MTGHHRTSEPAEPREPDESGEPADPLAIDGDELVDDAVALAAFWLAAARAGEARGERRIADRLAEVLAAPAGLAFTMRYVDRVARHRRHRIAADQLAALVTEAELPRFLGPVDRTMLRLGAVAGRLAPGLVMPLARARLRSLVGHLVIDARPRALHRHLDARRRAGFDLNVNLLGEMVLGEREAERHLRATLDLIDDPHVDYVSVKVSGLASQLDLWSFDHTVDRVCDRLRQVFDRAATSEPPTFVNLDMEEYRDLDLTVAAFTRVLDEPGRDRLEAGIVIQAYLPDALGALDHLIGWARRRHARTGAGIKIRLVKGANLAMERVDAALHGWAQAPYPTKDDVDANFERCVDRALRPEHTLAVRIGIGSHNLFDVAWAHLLARRRGVEARVDLEMLEGIAPAPARVVRDAAGQLLLYTPTVGRADFDVAISYLFRRLDESAAPDNFLRHLVGLRPGDPTFDELAAGFRRSVARRWALPSAPRRTGSRGEPADDGQHATPGQFVNEPDSDPTSADTRAWIDQLRAQRPAPVEAPLTTDPAAVDDALRAARAAAHGWWERGAADRRLALHRVATELGRRRGELIVTMAHEGHKLFSEGDAEVSEAVDFARWYGDRGPELEQLEHARFRPLGVVAVVPPWNFPVAIPAGGVLAALAAGNTVILKPAPETPRCAEVVAEACWAAGIPRDVLQLVRTPDDEAGRRLVTGADGVVFTGSWQTATMFRAWRPDIRLFAETSGKNALVVTSHADHDLAASDLVQSAFGHSGQKCSAASLGILVGALADDTRFLGKVVDAAGSLRVGAATEPSTTMGPLIAPAAGPLLDALTTLQPGERWLLEPRPLDAAGACWTPGIKTGVAPGSTFHVTECFGPVLGLMRARDLDEAIELQNGVPYGLTGGIHSLDPTEIDAWLERVEVGNAYVNRHITGAIVQRQPFGGWKRSVIGPGAKAGGPDQLLQLGHVDPVDPVDVAADPDGYLAAARASDERWMAEHYGTERDPTGLFCEANVHRYRTRPGVWIRATADAEPIRLERAVAAARRAGCPARVSVASELADRVTRWPGEAPEIADDDTFHRQLASAPSTRVRAVGSVTAADHAAAAAAEVDLVDAPVTADGRVELRWYLREQAISRTLHRFGAVRAAPSGHVVER